MHSDKFKKEEKSFAVETTLSGKTWMRIIKDFKKKGYQLTIFFIYLDNVEEAIQRISLRRNKEGHYVAEEVVRRRYFRSIKNFWLFYKNVVDRWFLLNNSQETPFLVSYGSKKNIHIIDEKKMGEFLDIIGKEKL